GWDDVKKLNPKIVMCSISAFGQTGPLSALPGFDYIAQAYAGVTHMIGDPDGAPSLPMLGLGDVSTGTHSMGAIAALLYRERSGEGQFLDISNPRLLLPLPRDERAALQRHARRGGSQALRDAAPADLPDRHLSWQTGLPGDHGLPRSPLGRALRDHGAAGARQRPALCD